MKHTVDLSIAHTKNAESGPVKRFPRRAADSQRGWMLLTHKESAARHRYKTCLSLTAAVGGLRTTRRHTDPLLWDTVIGSMIHVPCRIVNPQSLRLAGLDGHLYPAYSISLATGRVEPWPSLERMHQLGELFCSFPSAPQPGGCIACDVPSAARYHKRHNQASRIESEIAELFDGTI